MKLLLLDSGSGVVPFIYEILRQRKRNEYYVFMDHEFFPYGEKSERELRMRLKYLFRRFEALQIDHLLICCNTLSKVYLNAELPASFSVSTILETNLRHLKNGRMLVTPSLKRMLGDSGQFLSTPLAHAIEQRNLPEIIHEIKQVPGKGRLVLGCTHYPLVRLLFDHYSRVDAVSYESEFIAKLRQDDCFSLHAREYEKKILQKYFYDLDICGYELS